MKVLKFKKEKLMFVVIIFVTAILFALIGYYLGVTQHERDIQSALSEAKTGYFSAESMNNLRSLGGIPQNNGSTFIDDEGNTCMANTQKDDVICVIVLKDAEGNELIKANFDPVDLSTSYIPIGNNTVEANTYYWIPEYSGNIITKTYKNEDGTDRIVNIKEISGYRFSRNPN